MTDHARLRGKLARFSTSLVADALKAHGADRLVMRGVSARGSRDAPVFGPARTLRILPSRPDVPAPSPNVRTRLYDSSREGEVIVVDAACCPASSVVGDMMALRLARNRVAGVVTDGAVRDIDAIAEIGVPLFCAHIAPAPARTPWMAWEADVAIQCGQVLVQPGDWIFGDSDGVIVIPASLLDTVVQEGEALMQKEAFCRLLLERGHPLAQAFPLPARLQPHFERWLQDGSLPDEDVVAGRG